MIIFSNTKSLLYQMVEHQLNSQTNNDISSAEYVRENVLSAVEEILLLQSEIKSTHPVLGCFTFGPVKGFDRATERLIRVLQFVINVGLYLVRNELNEHATSGDESMKDAQLSEDQRICTELSELMYNSIVDLSNTPPAIPGPITHIDYFSGLLVSVVVCLRNILRPAPLKPGKHTQQFNILKGLSLYPLLLRMLFELTAITWLDSSRDLYNYFITK
jgi:hypothetical protein